MTSGVRAAGLDRDELINEVRVRSLSSPEFRDLLFADPAAALTELFGHVPPELADAEFTPQRVDRFRIKDRPGGGRDITLRMRPAGEPITAYTRVVRGVPELVLVLYTKRCADQCSMCRLPEASSLTLVRGDDIARQVDAGFAVLARERFHPQRISIGNEGSPLNADTLLAGDLKMVIERCARYPGVGSIIIETRAEYASAEVLDNLRAWAGPGCHLTLKVGVETADDDLRRLILRKRMAPGMLEAAVARMGERDIALAAYVLLKASPEHDDAAGRADALATCAYLTDLCRKTGTALELRINSMYRAVGTPWARWADEAGWEPPSIWDLATVMAEAARPGVPVFAGLSSEGLSGDTGHYDSRPDFEPWAAEALDQFNETGSMDLVRAVAARRRPPGVLFYCDVQARLAQLDPEAGRIVAPRLAPGGGGPAVFTAFAPWENPANGTAEQGFGSGWSSSEARAKAVLEAYERLQTRAQPTPECGFGEATAFTREDAIFRAFVEAVGRDAAVTWWRERLPLPAVALGTVDDARIQLFATEQKSAGRDVWMLDITSRVKLPAFMVLVAGPGEAPVFGTACHTDKYRAAQAAVLEAGQALCYAETERAKWPHPWQGARFWEPAAKPIPWDAIRGPGDLPWEQLAARAGLTVTVHDMPQLCDGLTTVRVTVPELASIHAHSPVPFPI